MSEGLQRDLGRHEALIGVHNDRITSIEKKLDTVIETLNQAKGGWKTLMLVGGAAGAAGAFIGKFLPFFK